MANEFTITINVVYANGYLKRSILPGAVNASQTTQGYFGGVQIIGTSEEDLAVGDVGTPGFLWLRNLDTTNYIQIGKKVSGAMESSIKLLAGQSAWLPSDNITWRAKANTASCKLEFVMFDL